MADNLAKQQFEPEQQEAVQVPKQISIDQKHVTWSLPERALFVIGSIVTVVMMSLLVSTSISATAAQHQLNDVQESVTKKENVVTDLRQEIGELTSSARMNKIARNKGLTLIEKNIRTMH